EETADRHPRTMAKADGFGDVRSLPGSWAVGSAKTDTNAANIQAGVIFRYVGSAGVYHCPADKATVSGVQGLLRTRSYSLDSWMHAPENFYQANGTDTRPGYYPWGPYKVSQHHIPPPSGVFVFIDEHE